MFGDRIIIDRIDITGSSADDRIIRTIIEIINSSNMVEICVKNGSAADQLSVGLGEPVCLTTD